jgi:hypothetical protein
MDALQLQVLFNDVPAVRTLATRLQLRLGGRMRRRWASLRALIGAGYVALRDSLLTTLLTTPQRYHCWRLDALSMPAMVKMLRGLRAATNIIPAG